MFEAVGARSGLFHVSHSCSCLLSVVVLAAPGPPLMQDKLKLAVGACDVRDVMFGVLCVSCCCLPVSCVRYILECRVVCVCVLRLCRVCDCVVWGAGAMDNSSLDNVAE